MAELRRPFVSVVIPHYNDFDNLTLCLDSLRRQDWPADRFEIVVADNNSAGGVAAVAALASDARVVHASEQGAGPARNVGAAASRGDIFAFLDADAIAEPGWLAAGVAALQSFDYAGGRVVVTTRAPALLSPTEAYEAVFAYDFRKYIEREHYSGTGNLFVPRLVFERVGGFRTGVAEDMDWCWRANALGCCIGYAEDAVIRIAARRRWAELRAKFDRMELEHLLLYRDRPGWQTRWLWHAALVGGSPIVHWLPVVTSPRLPGARAKLLGVVGLATIRFYRFYRMLALLIAPEAVAPETGATSSKTA
jgi:glycosyltransferase involved in cell wall biosynthesis